MDKNLQIAVLADIHSNHVALTACLDYIFNRGISKFIFLGDYVSDCPYPQKTMEIIYHLMDKYPCTIIRGNREEYALNYRKSQNKNWKPNSASGALLYNYENLLEKDLDFFESLSNRALVRYDSCPEITICHGSPENSRELLYEDGKNTKEVLNTLETDYLLCAHTHIQFCREYSGKKIINPGSVGVPWFHGGKTQFAILHGNEKEWDHEFVQLSYDVEQVMTEYRESGLNEMAPSWARMTRESLRTGIDRSSQVVSRVAELSEGQEWPDFPQEMWERAIAEIWKEIQEI